MDMPSERRASAPLPASPLPAKQQRRLLGRSNTVANGAFASRRSAIPPSNAFEAQVSGAAPWRSADAPPGTRVPVAFPTDTRAPGGSSGPFGPPPPVGRPPMPRRDSSHLSGSLMEDVTSTGGRRRKKNSADGSAGLETSGSSADSSGPNVWRESTGSARTLDMADDDAETATTISSPTQSDSSTVSAAPYDPDPDHFLAKTEFQKRLSAFSGA